MQQQLLATSKKRKENFAMEKFLDVLQHQIAFQERRYKEHHNHYEEQLQILKDLIRGRLQDGD